MAKLLLKRKDISITDVALRTGFGSASHFSSCFTGLADAEGVLDIEERMGDVKNRYGSYPQDKWDSNIRLMHYFEDKMGKNIYEVCEQDTFILGEI